MGVKRLVKVVDVAIAAGVSSATISRAFNSPEKLRPEVYNRVMEAVDKLGYTLDNSARALRSRRTRICGAIIQTLNHAIYAYATNTLEERLGEEGYTLLLATSEYELNREYIQAKMLIERGAEALVLVGGVHDPRLYHLLQVRDVPYINTYVFNPKSVHPCVGFDNYRASAKIIKYLVGLGHKEFGIISGIMKNNDRVQERLRGINSTLNENGLFLKENCYVEKPYSLKGGYEAMRILNEVGSNPTAVVCFSDILAIGAMTYCNDNDLNVPNHVSIVGFDNLPYSLYYRPALTTLEIPSKEMGHLSAEFLINELNGRSPKEFQELEAKLIVRSSTTRNQK